MITAAHYSWFVFLGHDRLARELTQVDGGGEGDVGWGPLMRAILHKINDVKFEPEGDVKLFLNPEGP